MKPVGQNYEKQQEHFVLFVFAPQKYIKCEQCDHVIEIRTIRRSSPTGRIVGSIAVGLGPGDSRCDRARAESRRAFLESRRICGVYEMRDYRWSTRLPCLRRPRKHRYTAHSLRSDDGFD